MSNAVLLREAWRQCYPTLCVVIGYTSQQQPGWLHVAVGAWRRLPDHPAYVGALLWALEAYGELAE